MSSLPINNFIGTFTSPAEAIPDNATRASVQVSGAAFSNPAFAVSAAIDFSPDGGLSWASTSPGPDKDPFPVIITFTGGLDAKGNPATGTGVSANIPPGTNRQVRTTAIVDGVPLTGQAVITTT